MDPVTAVANLLSKVVGLISQCMQLPGSTIGAKVEELKKAMKDLQAVKGNGVKKSERWQGEVDAVEDDVKKILEEYEQRCCRSFCCCWSCSSASLTGKVNEALETVGRLKIEGGQETTHRGKLMIMQKYRSMAQLQEDVSRKSTTKTQTMEQEDI